MKFDQELAGLSRKLSTSASSFPDVTLRKKQIKSTYAMVNNVARRYSTVDDELFDLETIRVLLRRICSCPPPASTGDVVPIMNITGASTSDLYAFLSLFVSEIPESATRGDMKDRLSKIIPMVTVQAPPTQRFDEKLCSGCSSKPHLFSRKLSTCSWCSRKFCRKCPLESHQFPRIGLGSCQLCTDCVKDITLADAEDWAETSTKSLADKTETSILVSLGCASVAIALGTDSKELLKKIARELHSHSQHELAYNIISLALESDIDNGKHEMKTHFLASSILKSLAQHQEKTWEEKWSFALACKEAYFTALSLAVESDTEVFDNKRQEIDRLLHQLLEEKKHSHDRITLQYTLHLESLWAQRDIFQMLSYLKEIASERKNTSEVDEDASLKAFRSFLQNKEPFLSSMLPEDKHALTFLKGVFKLQEEKIQPSLTDFESVAWSSPQLSISNGTLLSAYLHILSYHHEKMYSYEAVKEVLQAGSKALLFSKPISASLKDRSNSLLFPSDEELTPPFKENWPSFSITGHNTRCHQKYEEAVLKLYNDKKWSNMKVACAYLDEFPGCEHPAEMVVCYMHAAMWMTKNYTPKANIESKTLFAYKCVLMKLMRISFALSLHLNPGMELYVIRLIIGIMRKIALVPGSMLVFTDEDSSFLHVILQRLLKVSRMFPFWSPPAVSVSEAVLLNIVTRKLHSTFVLELQSIDQKHRPLTNMDLTYQLYENDLRGLLPLENSSDSRARAMEELLVSQGWSWSDVVNTMTSPLCPRDSQGWFIQSLFLGVEQQFYEITGFTIDTDAEHPSIKCLVVKADRNSGKIGLFSQEDINTMLQLDSVDLPLFFSLDPPSDDLDKQFHPFQQWRFREKVKDTELLNTMFITDYLMKSFTVGSDVSSQPPFNQRPCKEGLTKDLPPKLQEALRSIHERGGHHSRSHANRFWIEADEMKYDCQQNGSVVEFRFGEMDMVVKSHSLTRLADGTIKDTDEDDDPDSPHIAFARDMTQHYTELGHYFPVFARLRQLAKLQAFSVFLQSLLSSIKDSSEGKGIEIPREMVEKIQAEARKEHRTNVLSALTDMKQSVGVWPKAQDRSIIQPKVDEIKRKIREHIREGEERLYRIHGYNITIDNSDALRQLNSVESNVISALRENDENILTEITKALKTSMKISQDRRLKQYVRTWLSSSSYSSSRVMKTPKEELTEFLCSHLPVPTSKEIRKSIIDHHQQRYQALSRLVASYKTPHNPSSCKWVPAAVSNRGMSISYGGVAFTPTLRPTRDGERLPRSRNETIVLIQRKSNVTRKSQNTTYSTPKGTAVSTDNTSAGTRVTRETFRQISSSKIPTTTPTVNLRVAMTVSDAFGALSNRLSSELPQKRTTRKEGTKANGGKSGRGGTGNRGGGTGNRGGGAGNRGGGAGNRGGGAGNRGGGAGNRGGGAGNGERGTGSGGGGSGTITGCHGHDILNKACKSPDKVVETTWAEGLPLNSKSQGGSRDCKERIDGLYVIKNKVTNEIYIGRSSHVFRRIRQHITSINKGNKTVGKFIHSVDDMEFCVFELEPDLSTDKRRFYEQSLIEKGTEKSDKISDVKNKISAMNERVYSEKKDSWGM